MSSELARPVLGQEAEHNPHAAYEFTLDKLERDALADPHFNWAAMNDTLNIAHYGNSPTIYSGHQRRGAIEAFSDASSPVDFTDRACIAPFPPATPFPFPSDVSGALDFASANTDDRINDFRNRQLSIMED